MIQIIITRFNGKQSTPYLLSNLDSILEGQCEVPQGVAFQTSLSIFFCSLIQDPAHINNFIFPVMAFFPEPKSFGSADSRQEAARGRPRGAGERQRDGGGIDGQPGGGC